MRRAKEVSTFSKDPSTQVGAVIARGKSFISEGYNGFPAKIEDDERLHDRETKNNIILHAEQNAISRAKHADLTDATMYLYPFPPCTLRGCTSLIIAEGISRVVVPKNWREHPRAKFWGFDLMLALFDEAGVTLEEI